GRAERAGTREAREAGARGALTRSPTSPAPHVATVLDKELKRQVVVDGVEYTVAVDPDGLRLTSKGKRRPEVELRWRDLLSGDAAMAAALNASLSKKARPATKPVKGRPPPSG